MILGTSDGMVNKIAKISVFMIEQIIRIEDVATPEEMNNMATNAYSWKETRYLCSDI